MMLRLKTKTPIRRNLITSLSKMVPKKTLKKPVLIKKDLSNSPGRRSLSTVYFMLIKQFLTNFFASLVFFCLLLELGDLVINLGFYIENETDFLTIGRIIYYYFPECMVLALPVAVLFSVSYTMGTFYANNELMGVFAMGISLSQFIRPMLVWGLLISVFSFFFNDRIAIPFSNQKDLISRVALGKTISSRNSDIVLLQNEGKILYNSRYYDSATQKLHGLLIYERDEKGAFLRRIDAQRARWEEWREIWVMEEARVITISQETGHLTENFYLEYQDSVLSGDPQDFLVTIDNVSTLPIKEAYKKIQARRRIRLSYKKELSNYYDRFSFPFISFIIIFLASGVGGQFKKNILIMTLFLSLVMALFYYILQFAIGVGLGEYPLLGSLLPLSVSFVIGYILLKRAKT